MSPCSRASAVWCSRGPVRRSLGAGENRSPAKGTKAHARGSQRAKGGIASPQVCRPRHKALATSSRRPLWLGAVLSSGATRPGYTEPKGGKSGRSTRRNPFTHRDLKAIFIHLRLARSGGNTLPTQNYLPNYEALRPRWISCGPAGGEGRGAEYIQRHGRPGYWHHHDFTHFICFNFPPGKLSNRYHLNSRSDAAQPLCPILRAGLYLGLQPFPTRRFYDK